MMPTFVAPNPHLVHIAQQLPVVKWRVSSPYRPEPTSGSHSRGEAMDVAFWVYSRGGYTLPVAQSLLADLVALDPTTPWLVVAEDDHLHVERNPFSNNTAVGRKNAASGNRLEIYNVRPV